MARVDEMQTLAAAAEEVWRSPSARVSVGSGLPPTEQFVLWAMCKLGEPYPAWIDLDFLL